MPLSSAPLFTSGYDIGKKNTSLIIGIGSNALITYASGKQMDTLLILELEYTEICNYIIRIFDLIH